MPITTDVRKAVDSSRVVLEDARKPLLAVVGAGDLAVTRTASQLRDLPAETQSVVDSQVKLVRTRLEELRTDVTARIADLRNRAVAAQGIAIDTAGRTFAPSELRSRVETYLGKAKEVYEDLAVRGEKVVTKVSERPAVKRLIARGETLADGATEAAEDIADAVDAATAPKAPARKAPARKATAK